MLSNQYLSTRRKEIEERIAAETLSGNEVKLASEKAALAEIDGVERVISNEKFFKISSDGKKHFFEINGVSASTALTAIIESIAYRAAIDCCEKFIKIEELKIEEIANGNGILLNPKS